MNVYLFLFYFLERSLNDLHHFIKLLIIRNIKIFSKYFFNILLNDLYDSIIICSCNSFNSFLWFSFNVFIRFLNGCWVSLGFNNISDNNRNNFLLLLDGGNEKSVESTITSGCWRLWPEYLFKSVSIYHHYHYYYYHNLLL